MTEDPFAPPATDPFRGPEVIGDAERIRREHIRHEAALRSVGSLYILGAIGMVLASLGGLAAATSGDMTVVAFVVTAMFLPVGIGMGLLGLLVRKLDPRIKIPVTVLSAMGLINIPLGTLISVYILHLVWSQKGKMVLSPEYATIITRTPQVVYRSSIVTMVAVVLFIALAGFAIFAVMVRPG